MHDVLEGALEYEAKELLKYLIDQKHLDAHELNSRIEAFPYGYADAVNKPSILSDTTLKSPDHSLKQTGKYTICECMIYLQDIIASQMWCLARLLPLMIGEYVPVSEPHWENYTLMFQITMFSLL